jgi:hypothetical protein
MLVVAAYFPHGRYVFRRIKTSPEHDRRRDRNAQRDDERVFEKRHDATD